MILLTERATEQKKEMLQTYACQSWWSMDTAQPTGTEGKSTTELLKEIQKNKEDTEHAQAPKKKKKEKKKANGEWTGDERSTLYQANTSELRKHCIVG